MAAPVSISIQGTETLDQIFTQLPSQFRKAAMVKIFAAASRKYLADAKRPFKGSTKKAVAYVIGKSTTRPTIYAGLVRKSGNSWEYQRAYWKNFGTLNRRDPGHLFTKPRKKVSQKWRGGIEPSQAVGKAWGANQAEAERVIQQDAAQIVNKFLKQKARRK
jgi:hypothetical protein